jgi:hypothetical protein
MKVITTMLFVLLVSAVAAAGPCEGVNREFPKERKAFLAPVVAEQLKLRGLKDHAAEVAVTMLSSFKFGSWNILYVTTGVSDETFLFYAGDPRTHQYVATWSGAAKRDEEVQIREWTIKNAKGIPAKLAGCFAWYVTKARNQ